ncbi:MAG: NAD(P)H-quinone oxidoreductase [Casimicrobiaceae bacterium]
MPLPATMRYVAAREPGPPDVLAAVDGPLPVLKPGEVLIEVAYAGVNRPDCLQRAGAYPPPADASPVIGLEVAGRIVALGEGALGWTVGDEVCALTPGGGYAEYCATPAGFCLPLPPGLTLRDAACVPENYFTVWYNLFDRIHFAAGESVLIHGGTSGIGLTAIQLCKAFGATVFATAGSAEKVAFCEKMGADHGIDYRTQDFSAEVWRITAKRGVDVVLDMVGGDYIERNLKSMAVEGRLAQIAFLKSSRVEIEMRHIMMKRLTVTGSTLRASPAARKVALAQALREKVWPLFAQGKLKVVLAREYSLAEAAQAHALMESGTLIGKIVLAVRP